eukprot:13709085-Ditylum_brightwellii.AAC.1
MASTSLSTAIPSLLAAAVFAHLGKEEFMSYYDGEAISPLVKLATESEGNAILRLALPMTLNNVAGGMAGGVSGIGPLESG